MNMYYAAGAGMGHLTRTTAFFYSFNLDYNDFIIIVSSLHAEIILKNKNYIIIPSEIMGDGLLLQQWLIQIIEKYKITDIYLDTFPAGLYGEWNYFPFTNRYRFFLISRLLDWKKISDQIVSPPQFEVIYIFEDLDKDQQIFYNELSNEFRFQTLTYPPAPVPSNYTDWIRRITNPIWLIVHSEPKEEVLILYQHAKDICQLEDISPTIVIISPSIPESIRQDVVSFDYYPAYPCFEYADKIITSCGFNTMQQTKNLCHKHIFIPFERRYDNQFLRASQRKQ